MLSIYFAISYKYLIPYVITSMLFNAVFSDYKNPYGGYKPSI